MAKSDLKRCPQLEEQGKVRRMKSQPYPFLPAQGITIAFPRGEEKGRASKVCDGVPQEPPPQQGGPGLLTPGVEGCESPVRSSLHANHWACLCLTTVSRIGGLILGIATGLGACAVALRQLQFPFP